MKVSEYIAKFLVKKGIKRVYGLMGGGASGLNDGFIKNPDIDYISFHHEQSAGYAAIGETRITGKPSIVNPTTGCGGTNCATPLLVAWQDSLPVIFISGNVKLSDTSREINYKNNINIRKYGVQEHDIILTVRSMTKGCFFVDKESNIDDILIQAFVCATSGRPGPVWIDIPSDIQNRELYDSFFDDKKFYEFDITQKYINLYEEQGKDDSSKIITSMYDLYDESERPLILVGQGIKQAGEEKRFVDFVKKSNIPYVYTYGASDIISFSNPLVIGSIGIKGSRAGNFALQNCTQLLVLGCSLNSSHMGYIPEDFARNATIHHVEIDKNEIIRLDRSPISKRYKSININLKKFFNIMENTYE